jgi:Ca2+-binding RTX toxin-like protein
VTFTTAFTTNTAFTVSSVQATGIHTVTLDDLGVAAGANVNTINFLAGDNTLNLAGVIAGTNMTLDAAGSATNDTLAINVTDSGADAINAIDIVTTDFETVTIDTSGLGAAVDQTLGAVTMSASLGGTTTLNVTGDNAVDTSGIITAATIDFTGVTDTDGVTMGAAAASVTTITGSAGNDTLVGDASSTIHGGAGNDTITGGAGNDTINGDAGDDTMTIGAGSDTVDGGAGADIVVLADGDASSGDVVSGGDGTDTLVLTEAVTADEVVGYTGFETARFDQAATQSMAVLANNAFTTISHSDGSGTISLSNVGAGVTTLAALDNGNNLNITMTRLVDSSTNSLAITGNSTLTSAYGTITANNEETISIASGNATTETFESALAASDLTSLTITGTGAVTVTGAIAGATDLATVDATGNTAAVVVNASVSAVNVTMTAGNGGSTFTSGAGADTLTGGNLVDTFVTGEGNDTLVGGAGADDFRGGLGADTLTLGAGADNVILGNGDLAATATTVHVDSITDFAAGAGGDQVDLSVLGIQGIMGATSNNIVAAGNMSTDVVAGTAAIVTYITGAYDLAGTATTTVLAVGGTFANTNALETALETGGSRALKFNKAAANHDQMIVLYDDGTNTYLAAAEIGATIADNAAAAAGDLTITNILTFAGMADVTDAAFSTTGNTNFDFIA